jgi:hypothetical protein
VKGILRHQGLAKLDAPDAVAMLVERRCPDAVAQHFRNNNHNPATDAGFRRHPDQERKLSGKIVHPAGVHEREAILDRVDREDPLVR